MKSLLQTHDVDEQNYAGDTALHLCCERGHEECIHILIHHGADVWIMNRAGRRPYDLMPTAVMQRLYADYAQFKSKVSIN